MSSPDVFARILDETYHILKRTLPLPIKLITISHPSKRNKSSQGGLQTGFVFRVIILKRII